MNIYHLALIFTCIWITQRTTPFSINDLHYSFWADYNQFNNRPQVAMNWYNKALAKKDIPGYRYKGLLHLFKRTNNVDKIISFIPSLEKTCCNDTEIQLLFAQSLQEAGQHAAADQKFLSLLHKAKDNQRIAFQAAQIFMKRKEPENAISTIKDYLAHTQGNPNNFIFHFLAAQAYLSLDKKREAIEQLAQSVSLNQSFDKGWLLYALLNEQTGETSKAIEGYTNYLQETDRPSAQIQEHLLRLAFKEKLQKMNRKEININTKYLEKILAYFKERKYREALKMITEYQLPQENTDNPNLTSTLLDPVTKWYSDYQNHYAKIQHEPLSFIKTQAH